MTFVLKSAAPARGRNAPEMLLPRRKWVCIARVFKFNVQPCSAQNVTVAEPLGIPAASVGPVAKSRHRRQRQPEGRGCAAAAAAAHGSCCWGKLPLQMTTWSALAKPEPDPCRRRWPHSRAADVGSSGSVAPQHHTPTAAAARVPHRQQLEVASTKM